jgi:ATP-dependent Clp protease ATP-binding subunit ClpC
MLKRREPELPQIVKRAEALAERKGDKLTTGHLLAALMQGGGTAERLLRERRLDEATLVHASRVRIDDELAGGAVDRVVRSAKEFASRTGHEAAGSVHLLFALCQDHKSAAAAMLTQCGVDVSKMRMTAMQVAMGIALPPRMPASAPRLKAAEATQASSPPQSRLTQPSPPQNRGPQPKPQAPKLHAPPPRPQVQPPKPETQPPPSRQVPTARSGMLEKPVPGHAPKQKPQKHAHQAKPASRFVLDPKKFPLLTSLGKNLTLMASKGELDQVTGRDEEIDRALDVLAKRHANNPCLVGAAGVGKTSVVHGLAMRIAQGEDVASLDDRLVIEIEPTTLLSGTSSRGSLAERIGQLKAECQKSEGRVVLFFDEIHTLFGPEAGEEAATELKLSLARGELSCIGATTTDEYKRSIDRDPALSRRFCAIEVDELSQAEALLAITRILPGYERHHNVRIPNEVAAASVLMTSRYVPGRALPDKAISVIDLATARARRKSLDVVSRELIAHVVSDMTGVPEDRLLESDGERLLGLEALLSERIVGHKDALMRISRILRRNATGVRARRPLGTFLLLGPTGVGKTETAKAIAECLFFSADAMTRVDMSEYSEAHAVAKLIGAPPGYVGHDSGGQLTEAVRRRPYQVILLDEVEKAHMEVLQSFLGVFDEGRLTDGRGRTVDFSNTVILLTSNLGSNINPATQRKVIGFGRARDQNAETTAYQTAVADAAKKALPPELWNRIDEAIAFAPLTRDDVREVARRLISRLAEDLMGVRGINLEVSDAAIELLLDSGGFDPEMGGRPVRRAISRHIESQVAELMLRGELSRGDTAMVDAENGEFVVDGVTPEPTQRKVSG